MPSAENSTPRPSGRRSTLPSAFTSSPFFICVDGWPSSTRAALPDAMSTTTSAPFTPESVMKAYLPSFEKRTSFR
jgi:hypothetical protein